MNDYDYYTGLSAAAHGRCSHRMAGLPGARLTAFGFSSNSFERTKETNTTK